MSGIIRLEQDLPAMAMEILTPDQQVLRSVMITGGQSVTIPTEAGFVRIHLPSGFALFLPEAGSTEQTITRNMIELSHPADKGETGAKGLRPRAEFNSVHAIRRHHMIKAATTPSRTGPEGDEELSLTKYGTCRLHTPEGQLLRGTVDGSGDAEWLTQGPPWQPPFQLELTTRSGATVMMRVPGDSTRVWARADLVSPGDILTYSVRVLTSEPTADTILNYLARGNLNAAEAMSAWAEQSEHLLQSKMRNPYAATVGAYLLLRLRAFDRLHDWARHLAEAFDQLPDGCVLWAWQLIQLQSGRDVEIAEFLQKAAARGVPVYSDVTRLLLDGLTLMGVPGRESLKHVRQQTGCLMWESPLTMWVAADAKASGGTASAKERFNVRFGSST